MPKETPVIKIIPHVSGPISVQGGGPSLEIRVAGEAEKSVPDLGCDELTLPELLQLVPPGEATVLGDEADRLKSPLILASHGAKVDLELGPLPELLREANLQGRAIEIHMYGNPEDAGKD